MVSRDVLISTACHGFGMVFQGIQISQKGPAFIDLIHISGTDVQGGSFYIMGGNITYMLGCLISGYLYSRVKMTSLILAVAFIISGFLVGATPWCTHFVTMLLVILAACVFIGVFETTINTEQMRICKGDSGSAMQFLSFCYSMGGIIGPLITEPFLSPKGTANLTKHDLSPNDTQMATSVYGFPNISGNVSFAKNVSFLDQWSPSVREMTNRSDPSSAKYLIRYAFLITAVLGFMASIPFFVQSFRSRSKEDKTEEVSESKPSSRKLPAKVYLVAVTTSSMYYFLFSAFDDAFVQYLSYFVVNQLAWSKQDSAVLTAVYWIFSTCVKLALILLASRVNAGSILLASNFGMVMSCLGFTVASQLHVHSMVWVFTALTALSASAIFGGGMAWMDSDLLQMDGKATATVVVSAGFGATVMPIPIGVLMKNWNTMSFAYMMLGLSCLDIFIIMVLLFILKPFIHRKYGPPRPDIEWEACSQEEGTDGANGVWLPNISSHDNRSNRECVTDVSV